MRILIFFLFCSTLAAADFLTFIDLDIKPFDSKGEKKLSISAQPVPLVSYEEILNEPDFYPRGLATISLDAPLRRSLQFLTAMDRRRDILFKEKLGEPFYLLRYPFDLTLRRVDGQPIEKLQYKVKLGLDVSPGFLIVSSKYGQEKISFQSIQENGGYQAFLAKSVFPFGETSMGLPEVSVFFLDLYFAWPEPDNDTAESLINKFAPFLVKRENQFSQQFKVHLGTTFCRVREDGLTQVKSKQLHQFRESIDLFSRANEYMSRGRYGQAVEALESYLDQAPASSRAIARLVDAYVRQEQHYEAYRLLTRNQKLFSGDSWGDRREKELFQILEQRRQEMLSRREAFTRDESVYLNILSPAHGDLLAGDSKVQIALDVESDQLLQIECFLNDQPLGIIEGPPYELPFRSSTGKVYNRLKVRAYFRNGTYQERETSFRYVSLGGEAKTNLASIRTVVSRGTNKILKDLVITDFEIMENGRRQSISHFQKSEAPLRVAIMIDASVSMVGEKLYQAQYAVNKFIAQLEPSDRVSVYSFDHKVLKLSGFTNDYEDIEGKVQTLSPNLSTALHDAIFVAHEALCKELGTKVMIVVSDGRDTASHLKAKHVLEMLEVSPVLVYSIIISDSKDKTFGDNGITFLKDIASLTGSIATEVQEVNQLGQVFLDIYSELKGFYILNFYTENSNIRNQDIELVVRKPRAKARYKPFVGNLDEIYTR